MIKSADKDSVVVVWDREDHIKEAEKQLGDEEVYEEVSNNGAPLLKTINEVIAKISERGDLIRDNSQGFISYLKFIKCYIMSQVDQ